MTDGPFIETKEVLGGYWLVEAKSKEEIVKWAQRCPADEGDVIEIRQIFDAEDFGEAFTPELREKEKRLWAEAAAQAKK